MQTEKRIWWPLLSSSYKFYATIRFIRKTDFQEIRNVIEKKKVCLTLVKLYLSRVHLLEAEVTKSKIKIARALHLSNA